MLELKNSDCIHMIKGGLYIKSISVLFYRFTFLLSLFSYDNWNIFNCFIIGALENPIPIPLMSALEDRNIHILNNEQEGICLMYYLL